MAHHEQRSAEIILDPHVSIIAYKHTGLVRVISDRVDEFKADSDRDYWKATKEQVAIEKELHLLLIEFLVVP